MTPATRRLALLFIAAMLTMAASAQQRQDREEWNRQMKEFKHEFFTNELGLSEDQKTQFFALYDAKDDECRGLRRQIRKAEKELKKKGAAATDEDYALATEQISKLESQISEIEAKYYDQYKSVLTSKQMFQLKDAERKFTELVRRYRDEHKKGKK